MIGCQTPRIELIPDYVSSAGDEAIEIAAMSGLVLDEWQRHVLIHSLGERRDGKWAAPTVGLVVGRQNGKNSVLEARELAGLFLLGEKVIIHSAHEQATSSEHFRRLLDRIEFCQEFSQRVAKVSRGKGAEAIELRGGQRILFKTRTGGGGRGFTVDLIVYDEAMILSAAAKAALVPTLAANSIEGNVQTWYAGSAVDRENPKHDGMELSRIRHLGITRAKGLAYFEWSAPGEDPEDVPAGVASDMATVALANPGLGIRMSEEWVEHERTVELGPREFAVERLGIGAWEDPTSEGGAVSLAVWDELVDPKSSLQDPVCFAFDVSPSRTMATIVAAGKRPDGLVHLDIVQREPGTGWVVARVKQLVEKWNPQLVVCDDVGPAATLIKELEAAGVQVRRAKTRDYKLACGLFVDGVDQKKIRHLGRDELRTAIKGAERRSVDDAWLWSRKNSDADITPLVAATFAYWASLEDVPSVYEDRGIVTFSL